MLATQASAKVTLGKPESVEQIDMVCTGSGDKYDVHISTSLVVNGVRSMITNQDTDIGSQIYEFYGANNDATVTWTGSFELTDNHTLTAFRKTAKLYSKMAEQIDIRMYCTDK